MEDNYQDFEQALLNYIQTSMDPSLANFVQTPDAGSSFESYADQAAYSAQEDSFSYSIEVEPEVIPNFTINEPEMEPVVPEYSHEESAAALELVYPPMDLTSMELQYPTAAQASFPLGGLHGRLG